MKKINTGTIARTGIVAAAYMAITLMLSYISFGPVQFRLSEILVLLAWVNPSFMPGLILGCAMANMFSPMGMYDVVFGTFHTFCSLMMMKRTKNMYFASLWPTIFSFIIGLELHFVANEPLIASTVSVMIGEFVCISVIGTAVFTVLLKNRAVVDLLHKY